MTLKYENQPFFSFNGRHLFSPLIHLDTLTHLKYNKSGEGVSP